MVGTPKDDQRFIPAGTGSPFARDQAFRRTQFSGDTLRLPKLFSYITPLYFRLHISMVRCDVGVYARRESCRVLVAAKPICRVVKLAGGCVHCIRAAVLYPMQAPYRIGHASGSPAQSTMLSTLLDCRQTSKT